MDAAVQIKQAAMHMQGACIGLPSPNFPALAHFVARWRQH
jgi:hypothetical protein